MILHIIKDLFYGLYDFSKSRRSKILEAFKLHHILIWGLQFIVVTFIAMFFYPDGYSFTENYLSHLGNTINIRTGSPNDVSRFLFVMACIVAGACLIPFWIVLATLFTESNLMRVLSLFGQF
jgi:hypothetical membrane protein